MTKFTRISRGDVALGLAAVSLFVVAGGPAAAADLLDGARLQDKSVKGKKLAPRAVTNSRLGGGAVASGKIKDGSIAGVDLAPALLDSLQPKLTTSSITADLIGPDAVGSNEIQADAVGSSEIDNGAVGTNQLADKAVSAAKLDANSVTGAAADAAGATTLNFGTLPAGACDTLPVAISGADVSNDVIVLTPGAGFTGSTATASVQSSGQFSVTVCNLTAAPADPDTANGATYRWIAFTA